MVDSQLSPEMESLKSRLRATWMDGDFGMIAPNVQEGAEDFVARLPIRPGMKVLDVACGTGNTALPALRLGADVTGIDIAANLVDQAIANAESEGLTARFEVGDAEDLPYPDESFDLVLTMFGAMFAPRPDVTVSELKRVCKSGGLIAMANWTPEAFVGQMFKLNAKHVPPPPGMQPPVLWGSEDVVRQRFASGISDLNMERIKIMLCFDIPPADVVEHFKKYFGPTKKAFEALDEAGQAALNADLVHLWSDHNRGTDGTTRVESEYLDVRATKD
jgi:SAM-dependent methyltransferase